jgi:hypothetical protein
MDALKRSIANDRGAATAKGKKPRSRSRTNRNAAANRRCAAKAKAKKDKPAALRTGKRALGRELLFGRKIGPKIGF